MEHTPTPWEVSEENGKMFIVGQNPVNSRYVSEILDWSMKDSPYVDNWNIAQEAKGNAAFIVRACNSHDELVEALKLAYSMLYAHEKALKTKSKTIDIVKQALAKAEGR